MRIFGSQYLNLFLVTNSQVGSNNMTLVRGCEFFLELNHTILTNCLSYPKIFNTKIVVYHGISYLPRDLSSFYNNIYELRMRNCRLIRIKGKERRFFCKVAFEHTILKSVRSGEMYAINSDEVQILSGVMFIILLYAKIDWSTKRRRRESTSQTWMEPGL